MHADTLARVHRDLLQGAALRFGQDQVGPAGARLDALRQCQQRRVITAALAMQHAAALFGSERAHVDGDIANTPCTQAITAGELVDVVIQAVGGDAQCGSPQLTLARHIRLVDA